MSQEEAACLSGYMGQYISDPTGPQLPRLLPVVSPPQFDK